MIGIVNKFLNSEDKKRLFSNFLSLFILQGANYILPLITLPYLVRVLGAEKFGLIAFAQAFIGYFVILTDYGFNLSATREISINRENKDKVSEIFSSVMIIKTGLLVLSFVIMSIIIFSFEKFRQDYLIYYLTFGMVVGQVLFPVWFFQGMERMKYITILNILAKLIFTVAIFIFVHKALDYIYVPLINSLGFIVAGILALWIVFKEFKIDFKRPSLTQIKQDLKEGWYIFICTVAISLYTISNTFILGLFTNNTIVGYYSAAERIIRAIQGLYSPISQAIYPYVSKLLNQSKEDGIRFLRKLTFIIGSITFSTSLIVFIFADVIGNLLLGKNFEESIIVLRILAFLPFIIGLSNTFAVQGIIGFGYSSYIPKIVFIGAFINLTLVIILVPLYQHIGVSVAILTTETFITLFSYKVYKEEIINANKD
jgi:PST family polysaccharide transporter